MVIRAVTVPLFMHSLQSTCSSAQFSSAAFPISAFRSLYASSTSISLSWSLFVSASTWDCGL